MKHTIIFLMVLICSSFVIAIGPLDFPNGLISYWKFDEGSGSTAYDSQNGNDGTLLGPPAWNTSGREGGALTFNGNDRVEILNPQGFNPLEYTICLWVKPDAFDADVLFDIGHSSIHSEVIFMTTSDGRRDLSEDSNSWGAVYSSTPLQIGEWNHVCAVRDISGLIYHYLDGTPDNSPASTGRTTSIYNEISIGGRYFSGGLYAYGTIDEVAFWNKSLNSSEIQQLYNSYEESETIPEVSGSKAMQIFVVLIVALLVGALLFNKH